MYSDGALAQLPLLAAAISFTLAPRSAGSKGGETGQGPPVEGTQRAVWATSPVVAARRWPSGRVRQDAGL